MCNNKTRCPEGDDNDCPVANEGCFGSTECYYDGDLVPTATPVMSPTLAPSTIPPAMYKDPANVRYCVSKSSAVLVLCWRLNLSLRYSHIVGLIIGLVVDIGRSKL